MSFDRATFYTTIRTSTLFGGVLTQRQVDGTEAILNAWDASTYTDTRWLAYALGTAYHETAHTMYPIPEIGKGKGHPYGVPAANGQVAYGRGYVQLTWDANYAKADKELGLNGKLIANYDLALEPDIAAQILLRGMAEGWFTAFKLSDYLNATKADYLNARRIVNGLDHAQDIAGYALLFLNAITAGIHKAADTSTVAPASAASVAPAAPTDPITEAVNEITDTIGQAAGSILPSGGPSSAQTVPADTADESPTMNPLIILQIAQQIMTYGPKVASILSKIPDIEAKGADMIQRVEKLDLQGAEVDLEAILADVGLDVNIAHQAMTAATTMSPNAPAAVPPAAAAPKTA